MQSRIEHEFAADDNKVLVALSEELYRFSILTGVVGLALVALGVAAMVTEGYGSALTGPGIIVLGVVAMVGGTFFLRPRVTLAGITRSRGRDVTLLMDALKYLDTAHRVLRVLVAAFVLARLVSFLLIRMS